MKVSLGPAKGKDSATTLGPWLVTADELEPYRDDDGLPRPRPAGVGQRRRDRAGPAVQHGLAVRGAHRLRLARHRGPRRRRARLRHLRQRRLPRRAVGPSRASGPAAAAARRRRRDDRRGHRHDPQPASSPGLELPPVLPARPGRGCGSARREPVAGKVVVVTGAGQGRARRRRACSPPRAPVVGCDLTREAGRGPARRRVPTARRHRRRAAGRRSPPTSGSGRPRRRAGRQRRHHVAGAAGGSRPSPTCRGCTRSTSPGRCSASRRLTPLMPAGASIVVVGSVAALTAHFPVAYTASKWALRGLAKAAVPGARPARHPGQRRAPRLHRDAR